jgi:hypothetical protein
LLHSIPVLFHLHSITRIIPLLPSFLLLPPLYKQTKIQIQYFECCFLYYALVVFGMLYVELSGKSTNNVEAKAKPGIFLRIFNQILTNVMKEIMFP